MKDFNYLIMVLVLLGFISIIIGIFAIPTETNASSSNRFERTYSDGAYQIIVDQETGVSYLVYGMLNRGGGITPLLDAEGKPIIFDRLLEKDNL